MIPYLLFLILGNCLAQENLLNGHGLIYNGQRSSQHYPFLCPLFRFPPYDDPHWGFFCASNIISDSFLLSAAHCFMSKNSMILKKDKFYAYPGRESLNISIFEKNAEMVNVSEVYIHQDWSTQKPDYDADIALIKLQRKLKISAFINIIPLNQEHSGSFGYIFGWGASENNEIEIFPKFIEVTEIPYENCPHYLRFIKEALSERSFCVGSLKTKVPCQGDSGGGYFKNRNGKLQLFGIISAGAKNCGDENFAIATDVVKFKDWIDTIMHRDLESAKHSWIGSIFIGTERICSASVIHPEYAISAASCVYPKGSLQHLPVDQFSLLFEKQSYGFESLKFHSDWNIESSNHQGDIVIIKIDRPIEKFKSFVTLPCRNIRGVNPKVAFNFREDKTILIDMEPISYERCIRNNHTLNKHVKKDVMKCAKQKNLDFCSAGKGEPYFETNNNGDILYGIVSVGHSSLDNCKENKPLIIADIKSYSNWIKSEICGDRCFNECNLICVDSECSPNQVCFDNKCMDPCLTHQCNNSTNEYCIVENRKAKCVNESSIKHPYGNPENILNIIRYEEKIEIKERQEPLDKIFLNPLVKDRKIVVLSIIGAYREGKSFFLDYCLRYLYATYASVNTFSSTAVENRNWIGYENEPLSGFSWKHGVDADTKGIVIWSDVFLYDNETEKTAIVIMDTQGLYEIEASVEENAAIFGLSTLISSIQIINIKEKIQEYQIEHLNTVIRLTEFITERENDINWKPFQDILFLIRDFSDSKFEYGYGGGKRYLDKFLSTRKKNNIASKIRENINDSFQKISCYLLNHPGDGVKKDGFHGEWSKLEQEFVSNLKCLIESLLAPQKLITKSVLGRECTASELRNLIQAYFNAYRNFESPQPQDIYEVSINSQMQSILEAQKKKYNEALKLNINYDQENFTECFEERHMKIKLEAINEFNHTKKFLDPEKEQHYLAILKKEIDEIYMAQKEIHLKAFEINMDKKKAQIEGLTKESLNNYTSLMNDDIDYEREDFRKWWNQHHFYCKKIVLMEYDSKSRNISISTHLTRMYRSNLEANIDEIFRILTESHTKTHMGILSKNNIVAELQMESIIKHLVEKFIENLNEYANLDENSQKDKFTKLKQEKKEEFFKKTDHFKNIVKKEEFVNELDQSLHNSFEAWIQRINEEKSRLKDYSKLCFEYYKENLGDLDEFDKSDYVNYIAQKYELSKGSAMHRFTVLSSSLTMKLLIDASNKNISNEIDSHFEKVRKERMEKFNVLTGVGLWVHVDVSIGELPKYAVVGGVGREAKNTYVIRPYGFFYHERYKGIIVGKYEPHFKAAYLSFNGNEFKYQTKNWEILLHTNYEFVDKDKGGERIIGGIDNNGNEIYICRIQHNHQVVNGKEHLGHCYVPYGRKEYKENKYEILVKKKSS